MSISLMSSKLQLHVIRGRQLRTKKDAPCCSCVEVSLCPDQTSVSQWMSKTIINDCNPRYNEKYSIRLQSGDESKRLMISVYNMDSANKSRDFLGCMSFGIRHLISKSKRKVCISGWYQLLPETIGYRKHLKADSFPGPTPTPKQNPIPGSTNSPIGNDENPDWLPTMHNKLWGMKQETLVVNKLACGYGFTVKNTSPVRVGRVRAHGAAHSAGLLRGDYIVRINGQNVCRSSASNIADIVRHSTKFLVMDICRAPVKRIHTERTGSMLTDNCSNKTNSQNLSLAENSIKSADVIQDENIPPYFVQRHLSHLHQHDQSQISSDIPTHTVSSRCVSRHLIEPSSCNRHSYSTSSTTFHRSQNVTSYHSQELITSESTMHQYTNNDCELTELSQDLNRSVTPHSVWDPEISCISGTENQHGMYTSSDHSDLDVTESIWRHESILESPWRMDRTGQWPGQSLTSGLQAPNCSMVEEKICNTRASTDGDSAFQGSINLEDGDRKTFHTLLLQNNSVTRMSHTDDVIVSYYNDIQSGDNTDKLSLVQMLLGCEVEFMRIMQQGIHQFSRPLRHCVLSNQQHIQLFQNIEKLVALSEYHMHQIRESNALLDMSASSLHYTLTSLADIYRPRLSLLCNAYKSYTEGLPEALHLLQQLNNNPDFECFLKKHRASDLSLEDYIKRPKQHLYNLIELLTLLLQHSPHTEHDMTHLHSVSQSINGVSTP